MRFGSSPSIDPYLLCILLKDARAALGSASNAQHKRRYSATRAAIVTEGASLTRRFPSSAEIRVS